MSNGGLISSLKNKGIKSYISAVGDKNVCDLMNKTGAVLGGESSGHVVFSKYETTGDGLVTAIILMEALVDGKCTLSRLLKDFKTLPQITASVPVTDKEAAMAGVEDLSENLSKRLSVRLLVRPSGTERVIRIMAEGESEEECALACKIIQSKITQNCN